MRKLFFLILLIHLTHAHAQDVEMKLNGIYLGKNIYVQNPPVDTSGHFCVTKVVVNGEQIHFENSSAFVVQLDSLHLKNGDSLQVSIFHSHGCMPKILNNDDDIPLGTVDFISIEADSNGLVRWKTKNELHRLPFVIESFQWNKWVKVGEVDGKGGSDLNDYSFQIPYPHSGENKIRVKQVSISGIPRISHSTTFTSKVRKVKILDIHCGLAEVNFNENTMWELYDHYGNLLKIGPGNVIDMKSLPQGGYFVNYDNETAGEVYK